MARFSGEFVSGLRPRCPRLELLGLVANHARQFELALKSDQAWLDHIRGVCVNASRMGHAELEEAEQLDVGDLEELGSDYARLTKRMRRLNVMGFGEPTTGTSNRSR